VTITHCSRISPGKGFARARVDGELVDLTPLVGSGNLAGEGLRLARYETHVIDVVVDRLVAKQGLRTRIAEAIETAVKLTGGTALVETIDAEGAVLETHEFHEGYQPFEPRDFSFNSPYGACPRCDGLGMRFQVDPELVISDPDLSIAEGVIAPWSGFRGSYYQLVLGSVAEANGFSLETPWKSLTKKAQRIVLHGISGKMTIRYKNRRGQSRSFQSGYDGIIPWLEKRHTESESDRSREVAEGYMREVPCPDCEGKRLKPESRAVTIAQLGISDVADRSIGDAIQFFRNLELNDREERIAAPILKEVLARLQFLFDVGLEYLCLSRRSATLAGGEAQRIRLASQIGSGLVGVLYVLDEPSIGLHQRDNARLIETLIRLRDLGNTVLVVEHDEETIRVADHIVDIGPGAGEYGGQVVASGSLETVLATTDSLTAQYLSGTRKIEVPFKSPHWQRQHAFDPGRQREQSAGCRYRYPVGHVLRYQWGLG
jgi:excinuclease ABC subunit A